MNHEVPNEYAAWILTIAAIATAFVLIIAAFQIRYIFEEGNKSKSCYRQVRYDTSGAVTTVEDYCGGLPEKRDDPILYPKEK